MSRWRGIVPEHIAFSLVAVSLALASWGCAALNIGRPPEPTIDEGRNPLVVIETNKGRMTAELDERDVRNVVDYFMYLVQNSQAYTNRPFYKADGRAVYAGPQKRPLGFEIRHERAARRHKQYTLSIKGNPDGTLSADIVLMRGRSFDFDRTHTAIGRIVSGTRTLDRLRKGDTLKRIYVKRKKSRAYVPTVRSDGPIRTGDF